MTVIWLTGLSGAGKSTIGDALLEKLTADGVPAVRLDGDDLREGLNSDLGFSAEDRSENLRRAAHVAKLMSKNGQIVICSFITPMEGDRETIAKILGEQYLEVYVQASLALCESRDPKGLYKRARRGEIRQFTGISSPYEVPKAPNLVLNSGELTVDQSVAVLVSEIRQRKG